MSTGVSEARVARPYARAAFDYAVAQKQLSQWSQMLHTMAERVAQPEVSSLLKNPNYSTETRCEIVLALGEGVLDDAGRNFIRTLASYRRLSVLPEISLQFEQLRADIETTLRIKVKSAAPLSEQHVARLVASFSQQFGRSVELEREVDPHLGGGFIAYVGDRVIDSSVRGQFERLRHAVMQ